MMNLIEKFTEIMANYPKVHFPAAPGRKNHLEAALLVPISKDDDWTVFMTLRPESLSSHGGEICFPGGKPDRADQSLAQTAIREAREELGIECGPILGRLSSVPLYTSDYRLEPFVSIIPRQKLKPNPSEVECVLPISLKRAARLRFIEGIPFDWPGFGEILSPLFDPVELMDDPPCETLIYGGTAHVLWELILVFSEALGIEKPKLIRSSRQSPFEISS